MLHNLESKSYTLAGWLVGWLAGYIALPVVTCCAECLFHSVIFNISWWWSANNEYYMSWVFIYIEKKDEEWKSPVSLSTDWMNFVWFCSLRWLFVELLNSLINLLTRCWVETQTKRIYFRYQNKKKEEFWIHKRPTSSLRKQNEERELLLSKWVILTDSISSSSAMFVCIFVRAYIVIIFKIKRSNPSDNLTMQTYNFYGLCIYTFALVRDSLSFRLACCIVMLLLMTWLEPACLPACLSVKSTYCISNPFSQQQNHKKKLRIKETKVHHNVNWIGDLWKKIISCSPLNQH